MDSDGFNVFSRFRQVYRQIVRYADRQIGMLHLENRIGYGQEEHDVGWRMSTHGAEGEAYEGVRVWWLVMISSCTATTRRA